MLFLLSVVNYTDRVNLSVAAGDIGREFGLAPAQLGWLLSGYLWSYTAFVIPAGLLADRTSFRFLAPAAVAFWSIANASTAFAGSFLALALTRVLLGIGEAAAWPVGIRTIRAWAPRSEYGLAITTMSLGQSTGVAFGALATGWLVAAHGWRSAFLVSGLLGLAWAFAWLAFVDDPARARWLSTGEWRHILASRSETVDWTRTTPVRELLRSRTLWWLTASQGCLAYAYYMLVAWLPSYLQTRRGISVSTTGAYVAIIYGTAVLGSIAIGRATDLAFTEQALQAGARRKAVALLTLPALLLAATPWAPGEWQTVAILTVSYTAVAGAVALNAALCNDLVRNPADAGKVIALFVCGSNLLGLMSPIVTGYVIELSGQFDSAFVLAAVLLFASAVILLSLRQGGIGKQGGIGGPELAEDVQPSDGQLRARSDHHRP